MYGTLASCGFVCILLVIVPNRVSVFAATADASCASPVALLEGRRKVDGVTLRASDSLIFYPPSQALLDGNGWCSGQLGADIFDPYLEVNFGTSVLFTAIVTKGFGGTLIQKGYFLKRYRLQLAREDGHFWYLAKPTDSNSSQLEEAIFPMEQNSITNDKRYTEQLPIPVIGQILRIDPYQWSDNDYACTKLEVYGCPLQECQGDHQLGNNPDTVVTVNGAQINHNNLFNFKSIAQRYCVPTDTRPPTLNISFSSPVLVTEIGIRGLPFPPPLLDYYVKSFSLSYVADDNITSYTSANGLTVFKVPNSQSQYFGLWPPIRTRQLFVTIRNWQLRPCFNLWISGCASTDIVEHSIDPSAPTAGLVDNPIVTETTTTTETVILPTTVFMTTTVTSSSSHVTMTATNSPLPTTNSPWSTTNLPLSTINSPLPSTTLSPTATQDSSAVCSQEDDDDDNTPIYVSIAIVLVGVFVTTVIVIVGVIMCRRHSRSQMQPAKSSGPSMMPRSYGSINNAAPTSAAVGVDNDLYGRPELRTSNMEEDSDEEPLPLHDDPPNNPIYDEPPRSSVHDEPPHNPTHDKLPYDGKDNPTYGVLLSGEQSNNYSEPTQ